ncbi:hypothetical protein D3C81_2012670 [compost metagenome]
MSSGQHAHGGGKGKQHCDVYRYLRAMRLGDHDAAGADQCDHHQGCGDDPMHRDIGKPTEHGHDDEPAADTQQAGQESRHGTDTA